MSIQDLEEMINKKYGKDIMFQPASALGVLDIPRFSSGILALDVDLGGGWPENKVMEIFGPESSGKSYTIYNAIATVTNRKENNKAVLIDEEGSFDVPWAKKIGVNVDNLQVVRSEYAEQALDILEITVQSGEYGFVGLDSIAALIAKDELDSSTEEWQMGLTARLLNKACRKCYRALNASRRKGGSTSVFLINQLRLKIGKVFGNPETTTGGQGPKYASAIRLDLRKEEMLEDSSGSTFGQVTRYTTIKNKTAPPLKKGSFEYFIDGDDAGKINNLKALFDLGLEMDTIALSGSWYAGPWLTKKVQGKDAAVADLNGRTKGDLNKMLKDVEKFYFGNSSKLEFKF